MAQESAALFDRARIEALLAELGAIMSGQGRRAEVFLIGGGALALAFDAPGDARP